MALLSNIFRAVLKYTFWFSLLFCSVVEIAVARPPAKGQTGFIADLGTWLIGLQKFAVIATILQGAAKETLDRMHLPRVWQAVKNALDSTQQHLFQESDGGFHKHRVTLFQRRLSYPNAFHYVWNLKHFRSRKQPFWGGWLVPIRRSSHIGQQTKTVWFAPDRGDTAEGLAGQVWTNNLVIIAEELPILTKGSAPTAIAAYATKGFVTIAWVEDRLQQEKMCARSFCGIPVEVNNKRWGVVIIDSIAARIPNADELRHVGLLMGQFIGNIIEGGTP
jgi:hypothetical protein